MKRKTNTLHIIIYCLIFIISACAVFLILNFSGLKKHKAEPVGTLSVSDSKVFINDTEIPAYGDNGRVYIAAEDLEPFGVTITPSSDGNIIITCDKDDVKAPNSAKFSNIRSGTKLERPYYKVIINGPMEENFISGGYNIILAEALKSLPNASLNYSDKRYNYILSGTDEAGKIIEGSSNENKRNFTQHDDTRTYTYTADKTASEPPKSSIIVLDPGHGKSSGSMTDSEKEDYGWVYNSAKNQWGEWRHWKSHTVWEDCGGNGCNGRVTPNGACWYPMVNGDRDTEPDINLQNCLAAKKYLEEMGYTVRLTRTSNDENPSVTQRLTYCYPNRDTSSKPDAALFICVHSNAGGGKGSAYIGLNGPYDQDGISDSYAEDGNTLGKTINDEIVSATSLSCHGSGVISGQPELIAFCKSPVTCGYLEIGFYDNSNDLSILKSESDSIGKAIAGGIDKYLKSN